MTSQQEESVQSAFHQSEDIPLTVQQVLEKIQNRSGRKVLTPFELEELVMQFIIIRDIYGERHIYNKARGQFEPINKKELTRKIIIDFQADIGPFVSMQTIKQCAELIMLYPCDAIKPAEEEGYLGFADTVINYHTGESIPVNAAIPAITYRLTSMGPIGSFGTFPVQVEGNSSKPLPPKTQSFISWITSGDFILEKRIWEMIGYLLTPDSDGKVLFLLQGKPDSGKSVLGRLISGFFPAEKVVNLDIEQIGRSAATKYLSNKCLNLAMDLPNKTIPPLAVRNLKMLTGNDEISVKTNAYKFEKYYGHCKFLFATNHPLILKGRDDAFVRRIVVIPFTNTIPKSSQDPHFLDQMMKEGPAIAAKALSAYLELVNRRYVFTGDGMPKYDPKIRYLPTDVEKRDTAVREFVNTRCILVPMNQGRCYTDELYKNYLEFCTEQSYVPIDSEQGFAQVLKKNYGDQLRKTRWRSGSENKNGFEGILLRCQVRTWNV